MTSLNSLTKLFGIGLLAAMFSCSAFAADAPKMGADKHVAKGVACQTCHGTDLKNPNLPTEETCTQCHPKAMLIEKENELLELMNQAEEYINSIEKSELRMMFRFYYIDGMTWLQVAHKMNQLHPKRRVAYTEDSCRMRNARFFQEN